MSWSYEFDEEPVRTLGFPWSKSNSPGSLTNLLVFTESIGEEGGILIPEHLHSQEHEAATAS